MNWQTSKHQNKQKIKELVQKMYTKEEGSGILILGVDDRNDKMNNNGWLKLILLYYIYLKG